MRGVRRGRRGAGRRAPLGARGRQTGAAGQRPRSEQARRRQRRSYSPSPQGRKPARMRTVYGGTADGRSRGAALVDARTSTAVMLSVPPRSSEVATSRSPQLARAAGTGQQDLQRRVVEPAVHAVAAQHQLLARSRAVVRRLPASRRLRACRHAGQHVTHRMMRELRARLRLRAQHRREPRVVVRQSARARRRATR